MSSTQSEQQSRSLAPAIYRDTRAILRRLDEALPEEGSGAADPVEALIDVQRSILSALDQLKTDLEAIRQRIEEPGFGATHR